MSNKYFSIASEISTIMDAIRGARHDGVSYIYLRNASKEGIEYLRKIGYDVTLEDSLFRVDLDDKQE